MIELSIHDGLAYASEHTGTEDQPTDSTLRRGYKSG